MTVEALIEKVCADRELPCEPNGEHSFAVTLPGTHKLKTVCNLSNVAMLCLTRRIADRAAGQPEGHPVQQPGPGPSS